MQSLLFTFVRERGAGLSVFNSGLLVGPIVNIIIAHFAFALWLRICVLRLVARLERVGPRLGVGGRGFGFGRVKRLGEARGRPGRRRRFRRGVFDAGARLATLQLRQWFGLVLVGGRSVQLGVHFVLVVLVHYGGGGHRALLIPLAETLASLLALLALLHTAEKSTSLFMCFAGSVAAVHVEPLN